MIMDVVCNHFGSVDNFAAQYGPERLDDQVHTPWGTGMDFNPRAPAFRATSPGSQCGSGSFYAGEPHLRSARRFSM
jgi:hypothetical protein